MPNVQPVDSQRALRQAIVTEVLNPKTSLFFLSFLPQFVQPGSNPMFVQLITLGLIFVLLSILYTTLLAFVAGSLGNWLVRHQGVSKWQGKVVGAIYIGLSMQMAMQQRN